MMGNSGIDMYMDKMGITAPDKTASSVEAVFEKLGVAEMIDPKTGKEQEPASKHEAAPKAAEEETREAEGSEEEGEGVEEESDESETEAVDESVTSRKGVKLSPEMQAIIEQQKQTMAILQVLLNKKEGKQLEQPEEEGADDDPLFTDAEMNDILTDPAKFRNLLKKMEKRGAEGGYKKAMRELTEKEVQQTRANTDIAAFMRVHGEIADPHSAAGRLFARCAVLAENEIGVGAPVMEKLNAGWKQYCALKNHFQQLKTTSAEKPRSGSLNTGNFGRSSSSKRKGSPEQEQMKAWQKELGINT
jgi:hypothetical protein